MTKLDTQALYKMLEKINDAAEELEACINSDGDDPLAFITNQVESIQQALATHENAAAEPTPNPDQSNSLVCGCGRHFPRPYGSSFTCPSCDAFFRRSNDGTRWLRK